MAAKSLRLFSISLFVVFRSSFFALSVFPVLSFFPFFFSLSRFAFFLFLLYFFCLVLCVIKNFLPIVRKTSWQLSEQKPKEFYEHTYDNSRKLESSKNMLSLHGSIAEKRFTAMDTLQGALISVFPLAGFGYLKKLRHLFSGFPDAGSVLRKTPVVDKRKVVSSFWVKWERIGECSVDVGLRLKQNPALWTGFWKFQAPLVCGPGFSGFS